MNEAKNLCRASDCLAERQAVGNHVDLKFHVVRVLASCLVHNYFVVDASVQIHSRKPNHKSDDNKLDGSPKRADFTCFP